jgi:RNA polymerase sigma-70 factor (ECF subfamily)
MFFEDWYRASYPGLFAALTVVAADRDLARDATDEAMVRALERWDRVQGMASPVGWAYQVAVNLLRRKARRGALERRLSGRTEPVSPPELHPEVWDAIRSLPKRQRQAIALRYLLDLTEADVAEVMGVAVGTASATLAAARAALSRQLAERSDNPIEVT